MNDGDLRTSKALAEESMSVGSMEAEKKYFPGSGNTFFESFNLTFEKGLIGNIMPKSFFTD